jgi:hypothetical protein
MGVVLAKMPVDDGVAAGFLIVEVDDDAIGGDDVVLAAPDPGKAAVHVTETLQGSFDRVVGAISDLLLRVRVLPHAPDEAEVQFGLRVGGEAGLIVARGMAEVNFQVTLSWKRPDT